MPELNTSTPVGEWVTEYPQTSRVFQELQIDFCCGGGKPLSEACEAVGLDPTLVATRLSESLATTSEEPIQNWNQSTLSKLCDHIEVTHHAFLKTELPRLGELVNKVANVHGGKHPEFIELRTVFNELRAELEPHLMKEEQILFPAIRQLETAASCPSFPFGTVANPIRMMEHEHGNAGNALKRIRDLMSDYVIPNEACNTWRAMLHGLEALELDLHQHVHKENNILFPKAQQLEASGAVT